MNPHRDNETPPVVDMSEVYLGLDRHLRDKFSSAQDQQGLGRLMAWMAEPAESPVVDDKPLVVTPARTEDFGARLVGDPSVVAPLSSNPILSESGVRRVDLLYRRPATRHDAALVFEGNDGNLLVCDPGRSPTTGQLLRDRVRALYVIDLAPRRTEFVANLPSARSDIPFQVVVSILWQVQDASRIVANRITDVRAVLAPILLDRLRRVTHVFDSIDVEAAERAANSRIEGLRLGAEVGLQAKAFARLTIDERKTQQHRAHKSRYRGPLVVDDAVRQLVLSLEKNPQYLDLAKMTKDGRISRAELLDLVRRLVKDGLIDHQYGWVLLDFLDTGFMKESKGW